MQVVIIAISWHDASVCRATYMANGVKTNNEN